MTTKEFNKSVDLYSDTVFRFIVKSVGDEDKAKDIVQEAYIKLWNKHVEVSFEKVKSYLFTTAYRTMIDQFRKDSKQTSFDQVNYNQHATTDQYSDLQEILHEAVQKLPEDQRAVIMLRDYEGYSYKEIADITKLSEAQVKVYIYRARKFLQQYVGSINAVL